MNENEIVYGKNSVETLLEVSSRKINKIYLAKGGKFDDKTRKIIELARINGIVTQEVPREKLNAMTSGGSHQGIAASVSPIEYLEFDEFQRNLAKEKETLPLIIILDGVEDPYNFGSIIRTASAAGASGIIIPKRRSVSVTAIVEKVSAGAVNKIPIIQVSNLVNTIESLKKDNFWIIGAEGSGEKYYFESDYNVKCALVLGGEDRGVSNLVKKHCDWLVKIPMTKNTNSLNVSNAASIIIYEIVRQRISKKSSPL